jgi:tripartite-type tricarboxylate transporter receptor subunit TctC
MRLPGALLAAIACCSLAVPAGVAQAQPGGRVIRIVVPFAAGGGQEILARSFNSELSVALGQPVIVENRPGAGGAVGTAVVARAAPDGQTFVLAAASHIVSALLASKPPYDPIRDFAAVAHIGTGSQVIVVNAKFPAKTVAEFIKQVKAMPGTLNYGSAGNGSSTHLSMAYFSNVAGLQMLHVPYKSNAEPIVELIAGRIHAASLPIISALPYAKDERVRLLAVTAHERSQFLPQLPTIGETFPGYVYESWFGLLGPAGTPRPIIDRINAEVTKLVGDPVIRARIAKLGLEPRAMTPEAFERLLREDYERLS